ncbi:hypothetical protein KC878_01335 [Candidatus Saccharibacteria bacterium]|nr:hypothetical protein [Candidatus Saccharibacteria bacterium]MCB9821128.1 hypothetical protein [Candidatus Nomurabacteria bacterium]
MDLLAKIIDKPVGLPAVLPDDSTLKGVLTLTFGVLGGLSLLMITLQGLRYTLSDGDPQKTKQAKNGIVYALAGIVIALLGTSIVQFTLGNIFTGLQADETTLVGTSSLFVRVASLISFATGIASVIMIVVAGIKYNLSNGDPQKTASAKNTIIYALTGVVISGIAAPIIIFVVNKVAG